MLPILHLSNLYSEKKIKEKYPCLEGDSKLIKNLFFEFLKIVYRRESFYRLLEKSYYESNAVITAWQESSQVPDVGDFIRDYFKNKIWVSEKSYWISACPIEVATEIYLDLVPLWGSLLAQKIENEEMSEADFFTYMEDMYVFEENKSTEILRYPYRVSMEPEGIQTSETDASKVTESKTQRAVSNQKKKKSNKSIWLFLFILAVLTTIGYLFFQSGYYQRFPSPYGVNSAEKEHTSFAKKNIQIDSLGKDSIRIASKNSDSSLIITGVTAQNMLELIEFDTLRLDASDTISDLNKILSLPTLDEDLYYEIRMNSESYTEFKKQFPDLKFIYINEPKNFKYIILKAKRN